MDINKIISEEINNYLNNNYYKLYHGTSSNNLSKIQSGINTLYLTSNEDVAYYYAAKGGEYYFMKKEEEFEKDNGMTPDEYYDTEENGELQMFKDLYPPNSKPIVIELNVPKEKINNINDFIGYKGGEIEVEPKYINNVVYVNWDDLDY